MNFFARPKTMKKIPSSYKPEEDIVHYVRAEKLVKVNVDEKGNVDENDFLVEECVVESERVNRSDYINSFREDVGIANILKKVALSGDVTLFNQIQRTPLPIQDDGKEMIQDITPLQDGEEAVAKMGDDMRKTFKALPQDLVGGRSLAEFLENVSQAEIDAFVAKYIKDRVGSSEDKK